MSGPATRLVRIGGSAVFDGLSAPRHRGEALSSGSWLPSWGDVRGVVVEHHEGAARGLSLNPRASSSSAGCLSAKERS